MSAVLFIGSGDDAFETYIDKLPVVRSYLLLLKLALFLFKSTAPWLSFYAFF